MWVNKILFLKPIEKAADNEYVNIGKVLEFYVKL